MKLKRNDLISLAVALLLPQLAGGLGAIATASSVKSWYRTINRPSWNPPGWIFGPVWTALYILMGVASWLVWRRGPARPPDDAPVALPQDEETRAAVAVYGGQLALNSLWSIIFFGLRSPGAALADLVVLWVLIVATVVRFYRLKPAAGLLLLPYLAWSTFAAVLNATVWRLNRA